MFVSLTYPVEVDSVGVLTMTIVDDTFERSEVPVIEAADFQGGNNPINLGRFTDSIVGVV